MFVTMCTVLCDPRAVISFSGPAVLAGHACASENVFFLSETKLIQQLESGRIVAAVGIGFLLFRFDLEIYTIVKTPRVLRSRIKKARLYLVRIVLFLEN